MASIPAFLTDALEAQYGPALTAEILQGYASRRPVTLRVNTLWLKLVGVWAESDG